jgi:HAD superfamily hydrolase (TIGR01484 family)
VNVPESGQRDRDLPSRPGGRSRPTLGPGGVQAVLSDLDGTLLDDRGRLRPIGQAALDRAAAVGLPVVPATARTPAAVAAALGDAPYGPFAVCANGAVVVEVATGRIVHDRRLAVGEIADFVSRLRRAIPGLRCALEVMDRFVWEEGIFAPEPIGDDALPEPPVADLLRATPEPATKLICRRPGSDAEELAEVVRDVVGERGEVTTAAFAGESWGWVMVSAPGVTKGLGLAVVCERLGIPPDAVLAAGDAPNDLPLLSAAGWRVAVTTAHPRVRAEADELVDPPEADGLARLLLELLESRVVPDRPSAEAPG